MKLFRFLVPMGALLALLAFLPACEGDSGNGGTDTAGGTDTVVPDDDTGGGGTDIVQPPADTDGDEDIPPGTDIPTQTECEPACGACQDCSDDLECVARTCPAGQVCNPDTDACEDVPDVCDGVTCDPCETPTVVGEACECVAQCDAAQCETCVNDECVGCPDGQFCNAQQACEDVPTDIVCVAPNADGYCDASIVDELAIAPAPNEATGEAGCCCDFTGDGTVDNQLAGLVANLGGMAGFDLVTLNETVAESLAGGDFIILFEHVGLAAEGADTPYYNLNFYLGEDTDDPEDPTDNFSGTEEFSIMPESLDANGDPLITFAGAEVAAGRLNAGPAQFVIPVQLEDPPLDLTLTVDSAIVRADLAWDNGYQLSNGELCGYVTIQQIFNALNDFAATSCTCLNLEGDLIEGGDGVWTCGGSDPACDPSDPETGSIQEICGTIAQYCSTAVLLLPSFLDVDLDGDAAGDAISLGATFGATSAVLVDAPAMK